MRFSSPQKQITISGITVEVVQKRVKNINLRIDTATGRVRVSCPKRLSERKLREFLDRKKTWMLKHLNELKKASGPKVLKYETGENHYVWGKPVRLKVQYCEGKEAVKPVGDSVLKLFVRPGKPAEKREKIIREMYRRQIKERLPELIAKWEPVMGVQVAEFGVKKMKTRWGSCNTREKRIWLSLHLAKYPPEALEYVVVHEMVHLLERLHNQRFYQLMNRFLPDWRERDLLLKQYFQQPGATNPVPAAC